MKFSKGKEKMKNVVWLMVLSLIPSTLFADDTGWQTPLRGQMVFDGGGNIFGASTDKFGKTSSEEFQLLFRARYWESEDLPDFAEITKVEIQLKADKPIYESKISLITLDWPNDHDDLLDSTEIGTTYDTIEAETGTGESTVVYDIADLVQVVQRCNDGHVEWHGLVLHSTDTITALNHANSLLFKITYNDRLGGDADLDGDVDSADQNTVNQNWTGALTPFTGGKTWAQGDFDGDEDVDTADQTIVNTYWTGAL